MENSMMMKWFLKSKAIAFSMADRQCVISCVLPAQHGNGRSMPPRLHISSTLQKRCAGGSSPCRKDRFAKHVADFGLWPLQGGNYFRAHTLNLNLATLPFKPDAITQHRTT